MNSEDLRNFVLKGIKAGYDNKDSLLFFSNEWMGKNLTKQDISRTLKYLVDKCIIKRIYDNLIDMRIPRYEIIPIANRAFYNNHKQSKQQTESKKIPKSKIIKNDNLYKLIIKGIEKGFNDYERLFEFLNQNGKTTSKSKVYELTSRLKKKGIVKKIPAMLIIAK